METWGGFAQDAPELAEAGQTLLNQFGIGLAFLATVRKDGGPRVHPVCPILCRSRLYVFVSSESPKKWDLLRGGRYALHTFLPSDGEDESFYCSGVVRPVETLAERDEVRGAARHPVRADEVLFELLLERALHTTWENWGTPHTRPGYRRWSSATA